MRFQAEISRFSGPLIGRALGLSALTLILSLGMLLALRANAATSQNANSPLGINVGGICYYCSEQPLLNAFLTGQWITHGVSAWDTNEEQYINFDSNGWPKTLTALNNSAPQQFVSVGVLLFRSLSNTPNGYYPAGQYVVLYDGQGTISYNLDATLISHSAGRDVVNVANPSSNGIDVRITSTDPNNTGNYLRNIRFVKAENEAALSGGQTFNPVFLNALKNFHVLRFMDFFRMNGNPLSSWSSRPLLSNALWSSPSGAPVEAAVLLANAISADAWLNVPHMADDNYITQMANLVHSQLGSSQKVYLELSNEVWNGVFPQYQYAVNQGQILWPGQPSGGSGFTWNRNWYGMRVAQMCDIWKSAWGSDGDRVTCVLAAQAANPWTATQALTCPYWSGAPCSNHNINAVAIAPYFGYDGVPSAWTSQSDGGLASLFQSIYSQNDPSIPAGGDLNQQSQWELAFISALAPYKLPLVAYEGGQSFANGSTTALNNLYFAANRDARMIPAYSAYLTQWKANGGQIFMHYNDVSTYTGTGSWGALESIMQTIIPLTSAPPKWQALQNFISANNCWWPGCTGAIGSTAPTAPPVPMSPSGLTVK